MKLTREQARMLDEQNRRQFIRRKINFKKKKKNIMGYMEELMELNYPNIVNVNKKMYQILNLVMYNFVHSYYIINKYHIQIDFISVLEL